MSYNKKVAEIRRMRVPLARIARRIEAGARIRRRRAVTAMVFSQAVLIFAAGMIILQEPLETYRPAIMALLDGGAGQESTKPSLMDRNSLSNSVRNDASRPDETPDVKDETLFANRPATMAEKADESVKNAPASVVAGNERPQIAGIYAPGDDKKLDTPITPRVEVLPAASPARQAMPSGIASNGDPQLQVMNPETPLVGVGNKTPVEQPRLAGVNLPGLAPIKGETSTRYADIAIKTIPVTCVEQVKTRAREFHVHFDRGSSTVSFKEMQGLKEMAALIASCPELKIDIAGHTDKSGENLSNIQLSWQRAESVIKAIKAFGLKADQFSPVGYGATKPAIIEDSPQTAAQNRRAEFLIR